MITPKWGYYQGQLCSIDSMAISPLDHGFCYGVGAFESFRTWNGAVPLKKHAQRLMETCRALGIRYDPDIETVRARIVALCAHNELTDARVRWTVSAGVPDAGYRWGQRYDHPVELLLTESLPMVSPVALYVLHMIRDPLNPCVGRHKSLQYTNHVLAHQELFARGVSVERTEGLFLTAEGHVCEGIYTNVFWRKRDTWYTPSFQTGCLLGVTRNSIIQAMREQGRVVEPVEHGLVSLAEAEELFVTNAVRGIVPVFALYDREGVVQRTWEHTPSLSLWQQAIERKWQEEAIER